MLTLSSDFSFARNTSCVHVIIFDITYFFVFNFVFKNFIDAGFWNTEYRSNWNLIKIVSIFICVNVYRFEIHFSVIGVVFLTASCGR